jgi:hypothetical protein
MQGLEGQTVCSLPHTGQVQQAATGAQAELLVEQSPSEEQ